MSAPLAGTREPPAGACPPPGTVIKAPDESDGPLEAMIERPDETSKRSGEMIKRPGDLGNAKSH